MFFRRYRYDPIKLMELGIWTGSSLRMWEQYFENGEIFGVDYEDKSQYNLGRVSTFIADQSVPEQLIDVISKVPELDIIIEDGSHKSPHQILTFATLFPHLKAGGYYVCEDVLTSYNSTFCKPNEMSFIEYVKGIVGNVQMDGIIDDLVSDKYKALKKYGGNYFQRNIEWVFVATGIVIIKKIK